MKNEKIDTCLDQIARSVHSPKGDEAARERLYARLRQKMEEEPLIRRPRPAWFGLSVRRVGIAASCLLVVALSIAGGIAYQLLDDEELVEEVVTEAEVTKTTPKAPDLIFKNTQLSVIVSQLSQRYQVQIVINSPALAQYKVTASLHSDEKIEEILTALCVVSNCEWRKTKIGYEIFSPVEPTL